MVAVELLDLERRRDARGGHGHHPGHGFRSALVDAENAESLGDVAFARPDSSEGDVIPQGERHSLRVVQVMESEKEGELPVLVAKLAGR